MEPAWVLLNEFVISSGGDFRHVVILSTLLALLPIFVIAVQRGERPNVDDISILYPLFLLVII